MPIKIGKDRISERQRRFLQSARHNPEQMLDYLAAIVSDDDIQSGNETLHPDWKELFQLKDASTIPRAANPLFSSLPSDVLNQVQQILSKDSFDLEISTIDPQTARIVFLLGAGASKPKPSDIPTVKELLPDLLTRARRLDRADLQRLADFCDNSGINNIEDLLTAAQLSEFCSRNASVLNLVGFLIYGQEQDSERFNRRIRRPIRDLSGISFLQDTLQVLFGLLSSRMLPAQPNNGHIAIAKYVRCKPESAIVTTNYDCCVDLALRSQDAIFTYLVEFANMKPSSSSTSKITPLIKLHGSLNWYYCETCQQVHLIDIKKTVEEYLNDENCYSVIAVCKDCGGQRRGLLIPPLAMKFDMAPPLTPLIGKAQDFFNEADAIVVVGFSFADADMYISRMLTKSMQINKNAKVILFDPDLSVPEKLRRQLSLRITDFDRQRVIHIPGDCANTLPEFLEGKFKGITEDKIVASIAAGVPASKDSMISEF